MSMYRPNIVKPKIIKTRRKYKDTKGYCCGRCFNTSFEIVENINSKHFILVCSECQAIANENIEIIKDNNPSSMLMNLKKREQL